MTSKPGSQSLWRKLYLIVFNRCPGTKPGTTTVTHTRGTGRWTGPGNGRSPERILPLVFFACVWKEVIWMIIGEICKVNNRTALTLAWEKGFLTGHKREIWEKDQILKNYSVRDIWLTVEGMKIQEWKKWSAMHFCCWRWNLLGVWNMVKVIKMHLNCFMIRVSSVLF